MNRCLLGLLVWSAAAPWAMAAGEVRGEVLDGSVLRYRVSNVTDSLAAQLAAVHPATTNAIAGMVLDLRFAGGSDAVPAAAKTFFTTNKTSLVILVNRQTTGAAATLATQLREAGLGLVIGSPNAAPAPDIAVAVAPETEHRFQTDPYLTVTNASTINELGTNALAGGTGTNDWMAYVDHTSEADLVRKKVKDGEDTSDPAATPRTPPPPLIHDPALLRAVDLLKAWASLHPPRA